MYGIDGLNLERIYGVKLYFSLNRISEKVGLGSDRFLNFLGFHFDSIPNFKEVCLKRFPNFLGFGFDRIPDFVGFRFIRLVSMYLSSVRSLLNSKI